MAILTFELTGGGFFAVPCSDGCAPGMGVN